MVQITDKELAVYQMHRNGFNKIEIADALKISDERVEIIFRKNAHHPRKLADMDRGNKRGVI